MPFWMLFKNLEELKKCEYMYSLTPVELQITAQAVIGYMTGSNLLPVQPLIKEFSGRFQSPARGRLLFGYYKTPSTDRKLHHCRVAREANVVSGKLLTHLRENTSDYPQLSLFFILCTFLELSLSVT